MTEYRYRFGRHVGISQGYVHTIAYAASIGSTAVQVFPGNPTGWHHAALPVDLAGQIRAAAIVANVAPIVIHAPYIINLATPDLDMIGRARQGLVNCLARAREIGATAIVVHTGSHKGTGVEGGVARLTAAVAAELENDPAGAAAVLLENSAGQGRTLGSTFSDLADILTNLPPERTGVCIDTAHLWGAGYALSTPDGVALTLEELDKSVGFARLAVLHLNDSQALCGSHRDVHAHLGEGQIGAAGLSAFLTRLLAQLPDLPVIMETPDEGPVRERARLEVLSLLAAGAVEEAQELNRAIAELPKETGSFGD